MITFMQRYSTDDACRALMEWVRWPDGPVCPKRRSVARASWLRSRPGTWSCCVGSCKAQFSVTAGTPLHRTRVSLTKWFLAIWLMAPGGADCMSATSSKGGSGMDTQSRVPARKLAEWLDVDYRTAWYMGHRIRRLLTDPDWHKLSGIVEADEMYVGGRKSPRTTTPGLDLAVRSWDAATVALRFSLPRNAAVTSGSGGSRRIHRSRSAALCGN